MLSRDLTCYMTGKSTNVVGKKGRKEADIPVALFRALKEITVYESNLSRVEMEDPKGLEVVLLLTATAIKEVFNGNIRQAFNISDVDRKINGGNTVVRDSTGEAAASSPAMVATPSSIPQVPSSTKLSQSSAALGGLYTRPPGSSAPPKSASYPRPPPTDPRTQWQIDNETQALRAQIEAEDREQRRQEELRRQADEAEAKRLHQMLQREDRERKKKQHEVDAETERLKRIYGDQSQAPTQPKIYGSPGPISSQLPPPPPGRPPQHSWSSPLPQQQFSTAQWPQGSVASPPLGPGQFYAHGALQQPSPQQLQQRYPNGLYPQQHRRSTDGR